MKRKFAFLLVVIMVLTMGMSPAFAEEGVDEFPLLAGQDMEVGTIKVSNDGEFIYVRYELNQDAIDAGWCITETHTHVGSQLTDFPLNKSGNPQIGLFDFNMMHDPCVEEYEDVIPLGDFMPGDDVLIAAHAVVERTECVVNEEAPYGGGSVKEAVQGLRYDYTPVKAARSVPANALLYETGHSENYFYSLGFMEDRENMPETSWIVIEFADPIVNGDGPDLQIVEDTWGLPYPVEKAEVFVSMDGIDWTSVGFADNQTPINAYHTVSNFELPDGWDLANFVKVKDVSLRSDFDNYLSQMATLDGFDLNAVLALHDNKTCTTFSETAWGAGTRFVDQGSWATYFSYELTHGERLVDTVIVPSSGTLVQSNIELESGQDYKLKASGTFTYNNAGAWADAEWYLLNGTVVKGDAEGSKPYVLDVSVNGDPVNDDWGLYNEDNIYFMDYTGTGGQLNFFIYDSFYDDNDGSITVKIYEVW